MAILLVDSNLPSTFASPFGPYIRRANDRHFLQTMHSAGERPPAAAAILPPLPAPPVAPAPALSAGAAPSAV